MFSYSHGGAHCTSHAPESSTILRGPLSLFPSFSPSLSPSLHLLFVPGFGEFDVHHYWIFLVVLYLNLTYSFYLVIPQGSSKDNQFGFLSKAGHIISIPSNSWLSRIVILITDYIVSNISMWGKRAAGLKELPLGRPRALHRACPRQLLFIDGRLFHQVCVKYV